MEFKQIPPPAYLSPYIRYYWMLESSSAAEGSFRTIADGSPGLIFQPADQGIMYQNDKALPGIFLFGQATGHANIRVEGRFAATGIFFKPNALKAVFGMNAGSLTDTCMDLAPEAKKQGFYLTEQLAAANTENERTDLLSAYLLTLIRKHEGRNDRQMQYAMSRIMQSNGGIGIKELREEVSLTERSFERRFKQYVGITPKLFARITRFQGSLHQLRQNDFDKLSDIAFGNDYADQSHFIRAFREFAGISPLQYHKQAGNMMENVTTV